MKVLMTNDPQKGIRIATVLGTTRPGNYTSKALALVQDELRKHPNVQVEAIDPAELKLGFPGSSPSGDGQKRLKEAIAGATGVVLATPEYHGSFSAMTKLVIENLGFPSALAGKPVALLGVASGRIGAIKSLELLRGVASHVGAIALPLAISVANVQKVFDAEGRCLDEQVDKMIRSTATNLLDYIHDNVCPRFALEQMVREASGQAA